MKSSRDLNSGEGDGNDNTPSYICIDTNRVLTGIFTGTQGKDGAVPAGQDHYLMYSFENVRVRFPSTTHVSNHRHFTAVYLDGTQWYQQNNNEFQADVTFTPRDSDLLIASYDNNAHAAITDGIINGIQSTSALGGFTINNNRFNGSTNAGEYDIIGTFNGSNASIQEVLYLQLDGTYNTVIDGSGNTLTVAQVIAAGYKPCNPFTGQ